MAALIWTVGPSRPTDPPMARAAIVSTIFQPAPGKEISLADQLLCGDLAAAITWGMPEPLTSGA